jgi:hypothetical protein
VLISFLICTLLPQTCRNTISAASSPHWSAVVVNHPPHHLSVSAKRVSTCWVSFWAWCSPQLSRYRSRGRRPLRPPSPEFVSSSPSSTLVLGVARVGHCGTNMFGRGRQNCWCRPCRRGAHRRWAHRRSAPLQPGLTRADGQGRPVSERERVRESARGQAALLGHASAKQGNTGARQLGRAVGLSRRKKGGSGPIGVFVFLFQKCE